MRRKVKFESLWIDFGGNPIENIGGGRILLTAHKTCLFALTKRRGVQQENRARKALQRAMEVIDLPGFIVLADDVELKRLEEAVAPRAFVELAVHDLEGKLVGTIRGSGVGGSELRTEHGTMRVRTTIMENIRKGQLFCMFERDVFGNWLVYRATEDYTWNDGKGGRVYFERTSQPPVGAPVGAKPMFPYGPNFLVFLLEDSDAAWVIDDLKLPALE